MRVPRETGDVVLRIVRAEVVEEQKRVETGDLMMANMVVNVELIERDDGGESERAVELALELVRDYNVAAILGPVNSSATDRGGVISFTPQYGEHRDR